MFGFWWVRTSSGTASELRVAWLCPTTETADATAEVAAFGACFPMVRRESTSRRSSTGKLSANIASAQAVIEDNAAQVESTFADIVHALLQS